MPIYAEKYGYALFWNMRKMRQYVKYAAIAYLHKNNMPKQGYTYKTAIKTARAANIVHITF